MEMLKPYQRLVKAKRSQEIIEIQCHICKQTEETQAHSYCWRSKLCLKCANREYGGRNDGFI